jgi:hypothetical protein
MNMNISWEMIIACMGLAGSLASGWVALSMRMQGALTKLEIEKLRVDFANQRAEQAERRASEMEQIRRDINGSYMRANLVKEIVEGIHEDIKAIRDDVQSMAARTTLLEREITRQ